MSNEFSYNLVSLIPGYSDEIKKSTNMEYLKAPRRGIEVALGGDRYALAKVDVTKYIFDYSKTSYDLTYVVNLWGVTPAMTKADIEEYILDKIKDHFYKDNKNEVSLELTNWYYLGRDVVVADD